MSPTRQEELILIYETLDSNISNRLKDFERIGEEGTDEEIFAELVFCLLTPQSKARACWAAVEELLKKDLILNGDHKQIAGELEGVRFHNKKATYIIDARDQFIKKGTLSIKPRLSSFDTPIDARDWLALNIKGIGYKEASHFMRNVGKGQKLAILDRHILKNLKLFGVIEKTPSTIPKNMYLEIEKKMSAFARTINIPVAHLDLLFWYMETGEIFK